MLDLIEQDYFRVLSAAQEVKIYVEIRIDGPEDDERLDKDFIALPIFKDLIAHSIRRDFRDLLENKYGIYTIVTRDLILREGSVIADMVLAVKTVANFAEIRDDLKRARESLSKDLAEIIKWNLRRIGQFGVKTRMRIAAPEPRFSYLDVLYYFPPLNRWALAALVASILLTYLFYRQTEASPTVPSTAPAIEAPRTTQPSPPQPATASELPPLPAMNPLRESRREIRCHSCPDCGSRQIYERYYVYEEPVPVQYCDHW